MRVHNLKTLPEPFAAVRSGAKLFEWRLEDDRRFAVGDLLHLREYDPEAKAATGKIFEVLVTYIARGPAFGIPAGACIMSINPQGDRVDVALLDSPGLR